MGNKAIDMVLITYCTGGVCSVLCRFHIYELGRQVRTGSTSPIDARENRSTRNAELASAGDERTRRTTRRDPTRIKIGRRKTAVDKWRREVNMKPNEANGERGEGSV